MKAPCISWPWDAAQHLAPPSLLTPWSNSPSSCLWSWKLARICYTRKASRRCESARESEARSRMRSSSRTACSHVAWPVGVAGRLTEVSCLGTWWQVQTHRELQLWHRLVGRGQTLMVGCSDLGERRKSWPFIIPHSFNSPNPKKKPALKTSAVPTVWEPGNGFQGNLHHKQLSFWLVYLRRE